MKKEYNTEPKKLITMFLKQNKERHFTVEEISDAVCAEGNAVGKSTVYRQVAKLFETGEIRRFETEGKNSFVYQYAGRHADCDRHYHLKCVKCGRLIHMECRRLDEVREHITDEHDFIIGNGQAVLYGECVGCANRA